MNSIVKLILFVGWVVGLVVAQGFWMTLACIIPLVSWFVAIHWVLKINGWI